jgi:hypothetical protein
MHLSGITCPCVKNENNTSRLLHYLEHVRDCTYATTCIRASGLSIMMLLLGFVVLFVNLCNIGCHPSSYTPKSLSRRAVDRLQQQTGFFISSIMTTTLLSFPGIALSANTRVTRVKLPLSSLDGVLVTSYLLDGRKMTAIVDTGVIVHLTS